jgi:hypothetical protein
MLPRVLPGLVSGSLAARAVDGIVTLDVLGRQVPVRVAARARLFPTIVGTPASFVVVDYDALFAALNADRPGSATPSEAWFFRPQKPDFADRLTNAPFRLDEAVGVEPLVERLSTDPLAAGIRSLLRLTALVAGALGAFGLVLATRSTLASERPVFGEYSALGVPPTTLARSTQLRLVTLSLLGVAAGLLGGLLALRLIGAFVAVAGTAARPLPPIEPVVAWGEAAALLAAVLGGGLVGVTAVAGRELREVAARRLRV